MVNTDLSIEFGGITKANIEQLRLINASTLPVRYSDKFYGDLVTIGDPRFLKFAIFNGFTVGAVCARVESISDDPENPIKKLYIMTLNVLPSYRRRGIASKLLDHILKVAKLESDIIEIYLHVQISNDEAISFYEGKYFTNAGRIDDYYKRIEPPHAYILKFDLKKQGDIDKE